MTRCFCTDDQECFLWGRHYIFMQWPVVWLNLKFQRIKSDTVHLHSSCWKSSYVWSEGSFSFDTLQSSSSVGATTRYGLWPVEQYVSIFSYLSPTLSIFSLPALEDLFLLLLSILSWGFLFVLSLPVLEWRSFWASYPPPFSPGDPANLSFAPLSILLYFLLYSTLLVLDFSYFSIPHLHI